MGGAHQPHAGAVALLLRRVLWEFSLLLLPSRIGWCVIKSSRQLSDRSGGGRVTSIVWRAVCVAGPWVCLPPSRIAAAVFPGPHSSSVNAVFLQCCVAVVHSLCHTVPHVVSAAVVSCRRALSLRTAHCVLGTGCIQLAIVLCRDLCAQCDVYQCVCVGLLCKRRPKPCAAVV